MTKRDKILNKIVSVISKTDPDSEVYLYGSQARGDYNINSDWDLLILLNMNGISFDFETKIMDDFYDLELETGVVISPLVYSKNEWNDNHFVTPLYENIEREGVRLK